MTAPVLTPDELVELTGSKQRPGQEAFLTRMRIPYGIGQDRKIKVWRTWVDLAPWRGDEAKGDDGPDWSVFDGPQAQEQG